MLSALSNINGAAFQIAADRPKASAVRSETAVAALAALAPAQPIPSASDPFSFEEDDQAGFDFLYRPSGLPTGQSAPSYATEPLADTPETRALASRDSSTRLAVESTQLSNLLSALMTTNVAEPRNTPAVEQQPPVPASASPQSLIAKLYQQF